MREIFEFRVGEALAKEFLGADVGESIGYGVRKVLLEASDPLFARMREVIEGGQRLHSGWNVTRRYTAKEIEAARLFLFTPLAYFEPTGEECGSIYDDGPACDLCLAGAMLAGPLFLSLGSIPKGKDIAVTIAGEIVVSQRFVDVFKANAITGVSFHPVRRKRMKDLQPTGWYQMALQPPYVEIADCTARGISPFDPDVAGEYRCPNGDTIGLNILSEVTITAASRGEADVIATRQFSGRRAGLLRQQRLILVSPKVHQLMVKERLKAVRFEVAYLDA